MLFFKKVKSTTLIPVLPKNYRAIALEAIEISEQPKVLYNKKEIFDFSERGPITQNNLRKCRDFEVRDGDTPIFGFHDHPSQMWISTDYSSFAEFCKEEGWLTIEGPAC